MLGFLWLALSWKWGQKLENCQLLSAGYLGPVVAEVISELTVSLVGMAV